MYQALLTRKYLTSKIVPLLGVAAVALCSLLVLTTWSIMGGFLTMLLAIGHDMEGDVSISWPSVGFAHYEELIKRVEADPMVEAACPMIETFGMITLPDGRRGGGGAVQIKGVDPRFAKVTNYAESIWWKPIDKPLPKDKERRDLRLDPNLKPALDLLQQDALRFQEPDPEHGGRLTPAVVLGIELGGFSIRDKKGRGYYRPADTVFKRMPNGEFEPVPGFLPLQGVTVTVLPLTEKTRDIGVVQQYLPVANEYRTGLYESDRSSALMDLGELQRMLKLNEWERLEPIKTDPYAIEKDASGRELSPSAKRQVIGKEPARVTTVLVKAKPRVSPEKLHARCVEIWAEFAAAHPGEVPSAEAMEDSRTILTFEMSRATFIGAVRQETAVVLFLLILLSAIAATLILSIFWAMVSEKTKDIGTLRAIGASGPGVAWIWLRFGLFIGTVGAIVGLLGATAIVWNINPIHEWLGELFGLSLWDPKVYYFTKIPNVVDPVHAAIVGAGALLFSLLGALIPSIRAARMDPVKALRFE